MTTRRKLVLVLASALLVGAAVFGNPGIRPAFAVPSNDQGCYCHNNGIGVWFNGTGFLEFTGINFTVGGTVHVNVTSANIAATGVVPGTQEWMSNDTDTGKFTFSPQMVQDGTPQDLHPATGNITGIYTITAPATAGTYTLTIYVQGTLVTVSAFVGSGGSTTNTTGTGPSSSTTTTTPTGTTTKSSGQDWLAGFPGLNLITLYLTAGLALAIGVLLGVGVALRARKVRVAK